MSAGIPTRAGAVRERPRDTVREWPRDAVRDRSHGDAGERPDRAIRRKAVWGSGVRLTVVTLLALLSSSCGEAVRQGTGSSYLIVESLQAASGAEPGEFGTTLHSDVITVIEDNVTYFNDIGQVTFRLGMKDPALATEPTQANWITVNRYRVRYIRSDGRNTPGVDVPYPFDGAMTVTVSDAVTIGFELVRHVAKKEAPLKALADGSVIISTIAEVTFWGKDQTGREVSVTANLFVDFGNFADPD